MLLKWWNLIAKANAEAFDHFGWGYYTRESFDAFYPGYGTSYPSINGAVGMTYEQASARGVSINRNDGTVLTLREASWHHFTTSMATLRVVSERREEKVRDFHEFFRIGLDEAKSDPMKEILLTSRNDPHITAKLITNLLQEKVEIRRAVQEFTHPRATSYLTKKKGSVTFPAGTYIVSLAQPQKILIKALLAPESPLSDVFIAEEKRRQAEGERSHFYDVTAWSLPLTMGVDAYWTESPARVATEPVRESPEFSGSLQGGTARQVYVVPFNTLAASKLLIRLLDSGFRVRMARQSFTVKGRTWPRGTLVIRVNRNPADLHDRFEKLCEKMGVDAYALHHGLAQEGVDLGSNNIVTLKNPRVALLTKEPVSSGSYGAIHYLFEREFNLPFVRVSARDLGALHQYDVIVMPSGNYGSAWSKTQQENVKQWIRSGGTVVAVSGASSWLRSAKISQVELLNRQPDPKDKSLKIRPQRTPGAIVKVDLNPLSFLSYGVPASVAVLLRSSTICVAFETRPSRNVGVYAPAEELKLSGYMWPDTERYLAGGGWLYMEPMGRGKVISFVEDPNFRASYDGLNKLFLNAVLLGPSISDSRRYE